MLCRFSFKGFTGRVSVTLGLLCLLGTPAQAQDLSSQQAQAYVALMPQLRAFADQLDPALGQRLRRELQPVTGEAFRPHARGLDILQREQPAQYRALDQLARSGRFVDATSWSWVGDRVLLGYAALKAEAAYPQILELARSMQTMDPALQAMMPPQFQTRVAQIGVMAQEVARVSEADKAVLRPLLVQLDAHWKNEWQAYQSSTGTR
ncbi:hypothetical protein [Marinobacterium rhizophilum]|uniref:DUF885 domain-containing protein n=1 Tax=Marinobacterium rhizophilum TaxID=420402 RepID=A0ABY5HRX1_9GAMM|nr:hypothetical protein [Marinobacterium rhizophilum]UTW13925.1 hypothetical protein KDW95_09925 [Marinobacterium rhizophilum]